MNKIMLRRFLLTAFIITFGGAAVFACEMIFTLEGQSYKITVELNEDHRNCKIPADETPFFIERRKMEG